MSSTIADKLTEQGIKTRVADERIVHRAAGVLMASCWRSDYSDNKGGNEPWWQWWRGQARVCWEVSAKDIIGWSEEIAQQCGLPAGLENERVLVAGNGPNIVGDQIVFRVEHVMGYLEPVALEDQR